MRTKAIFFVILLLIVSNICKAQKYRKYPIKSGKVEYKIEGNTSGTQTIIWDDYGYKELTTESSESKMFGQTTITKDNTLMIGSEVYSWSYDDNHLYQSSNPLAQQWEDENYDDDDVEEFSIKTIEALGFEKIGTETILGKSCDVYKGLGKIWVWKGLSLKTEVKMLGTKYTVTATDIKTNISIAASKFEYPKDLELIINGNIDQHSEEEIDEAIDIKADEIKDALNSLFGGN